MTTKAVALKPGVLFAATASGGTLMDIGSDRFIALSPVSAMVWRGLAMGQVITDVIENLAIDRGITFASAETILSSQLRLWEQAQLINIGGQSEALPVPKSSSAGRSTRELSINGIQTASLIPRLVLSLYIAEWKYRRALTKVGLAKTLIALQAEAGRPSQPPSVVVHRTLRAYYAARRAFKQGNESRDCLFRSMALTAVLKRQGIDAELCIGIVDMPFASHAWVEIDGWIVNDSLSTSERYAVIARF